MEKVTDWLKLWAQLVLTQDKTFWHKHNKNSAKADAWKERARSFDRMVEKRWAQPDSSRQFIQSALKNHPNSTLLDIGAGTGAWSLFLSPWAKQITALEPSEAMGEILKEKIAAQHIANVRLIKGRWPDTDIEPHDYILASHSMYGASDFSKFILKMIHAARKTCFLVLRAPFLDAPMAKAAWHVWGQPYDSPNFQIAYNALLQMGIFPNVLMETGSTWEPWHHESKQAALSEIKSRLGIDDTSEYDRFLKDLLDDYLIEKDGEVVWPVSNCSVLVYWEAQ